MAAGKVIRKNKFIYNVHYRNKWRRKHGNGRDYWVVCHEIIQVGLLNFLLTPDSLFGPFYQTIGNSLDYSYFVIQGKVFFRPKEINI